MTDPTWPAGSEPTLPGGPGGSGAPGGDAPTWPGGVGGAPTWPGSPGASPPAAADPTRIPPTATGPHIPPPLPPTRSTRSNRRPPGARTFIGIVMLFVAGLSVVGAVAAGWTRTQIRDEDTWAATADALADDPAVQQAVADALAVQVMAVSGAEDLIQGVLPGPLSALADPLTGSATDLVSSVALQLVQTDAFQSAWEAAVRNSHSELISALDGNGRFTTIGPEGIELDLGSTLGQFRQLLDDSGLTFLDGIDLSGIDVQFLLIDAPELQRVRDLIEVLDGLVVVLPIVALVAGIAGLVVARRRSWAVVAGGLGMLSGVGLVLLVSRAGQDRAADEFTGGILGPAAADAVVTHVTDSLHSMLGVLAVAGVVVLVVGAGAAAVSARRA